jgi:hypothetical protein
MRLLSVLLLPFDEFDDPYGDSGMGIPGWFVALFVLVILIGIASTAYRVSTARSIARKAGLDPDDATRVTLLVDDALSATYLASQLHDRSPDTAAEYAERRAAILGTL